MILIFKTSLQTAQDCQQVARLLDNRVEIDHWTVDLEDCDKILRVVTSRMTVNCVARLVQSSGFDCAELDD